MTGARVRSAPDANLLTLASGPGAGVVKVVVTAASHHPREASAIPGDCPRGSEQSLLIAGGTGRIVRITMFIDGVRVAIARGQSLSGVGIPPALADGSVVRLVIRTAGGRTRTLVADVRDCSLTLQP